MRPRAFGDIREQRHHYVQSDHTKVRSAYLMRYAEDLADYGADEVHFSRLPGRNALIERSQVSSVAPVEAVTVQRPSWAPPDQNAAHPPMLCEQAVLQLVEPADRLL
jgi:hypothetical protein